ncbi:MAG: hypothetical protein AB3N16_10650 [Flavobacteriaceae bacterium]
MCRPLVNRVLVLENSLYRGVTGGMIVLFPSRAHLAHEGLYIKGNSLFSIHHPRLIDGTSNVEMGQCVQAL